MNITKADTDKLNAVLSISLEKNDYEDRVTNSLKEYRKQARIDGFRPGKVPFGLISKMYRKPVLVEEVNKLISESISKFFVDEKIHVLGDPLPNLEDAQSIDWDNDESFDFKFDLGLAPELDFTLSTKDKFPFYKIKIDDTLINKYIDSYTQRLGEFVSVDDSPAEKDMLKVNLKQLDENDAVLAEGIQVEEASISIEMAKDDGIKKQLLTLSKGATLIIDLKKAYPSDSEIAALLKVEKEQAANITGNFELTVNEVSRFQNAEVNQDLFDKLFGPGTVKSEEEFRAKVAEEAEKGILQDSEYRFRIDVKEILIKKTKFDLPKDFLKRWLFTVNEGKFTEEQIDKDFDSFSEDLKWQLIKDHIVKQNELEIGADDMMKAALETARMQFAQYGMANVPDEHLEEFARRMMEKPEDLNNLRSKVTEDKVIDFVKSTSKIDEKELSSDKFGKLFEK